MDISFTLDELPAVAKQFTQSLANKKVFAFHGQMGAGKTTLIRALCNEYQVRDVVSSPTFSIINEYQSERGRIFHIDLYRLSDGEEAIHAGVEECLYSGHICLVEWPERAENLLPDDSAHIYLYAVDEITRRLLIEDK